MSSRGFSIEKALELKGFPKSAVPVALDDPNYNFVEYDESRDSYPKGTIIVVPHADWVVKSIFRKTEFFISGTEHPEEDDEHQWYILRFSTEKNQFSKWYVRGKNKTFKPSGLIKINVNESEELIMEDNKTVVNEKVEGEELDLNLEGTDFNLDGLNTDGTGEVNDIAAQLEQSSDFSVNDNNEVTPSDAFNEGTGDSTDGKSGSGKHLTEEEKAARKAKREAAAREREEQAKEFAHAIEETLGDSNDGRPDLARLQIFNQTYGVFFGYITQNDNLFKVTTKKVYEKDSDGNYVLIDTAPDEIKKIAAQPNGLQNIDKSYFSYSHDLGFKDVAPGKILGAVIGIPRGGLIDLTECQKADGDVTPKEDQTDLVVDLYTLDEAIDVISILFGQRIKEAPDTFGAEAGWVVTGATRKTSVKDGTTIKTVVPFLKPEGRKIKVCRNAYFPLNTYLKKAVDGPLSKEDAALLSLSSFFHLYQSGSGSSTATKASQLSPAFVSKIRKNADGSFESDYFAENQQKREPIKVSSCFSSNKEELMPIVEVPIKKVTITKTSHKEMARYRSFNLTDPTKAPELSNISALNQVGEGQKFHTFFSVVGSGILNVEKLKTLTSRRGNSSKTSNELNNSTFQSLLLARQGNKLNKVEGLVIGGGASEDLNSKILRARIAQQNANANANTENAEKAAN